MHVTTTGGTESSIYQNLLFVLQQTGAEVDSERKYRH